MDRQDAVWYYRLGGQTLGPVPWTEIEELTRDTVDAEHLLVARGGDQEWKSAAEILTEFPELARKEPQEPAPTVDFEMPPDEPEEWQVIAEEPSAAASDVLGAAAETRDTGRAAASTAHTPPTSAVSPGAGGGFTPVHGLGQWIGQAWEMVINDIWAWIGALLLVFLVGGVTLGLTVPPLMAGLYIMALDRYRGTEIGPGDVFRGFGLFLRAWGLNLIMMIPALIVMAPMMILIAVPLAGAAGGGENMEDVVFGLTFGIYLLLPVLWLLVMAVQTIFFYSWVLIADGHGAWESVTMSWEKVSRDFWSYLGMWLVFSILASLGSYVCSIGILLTYPLLPCAQVATYMWHFRRA